MAFRLLISSIIWVIWYTTYALACEDSTTWTMKKPDCKGCTCADAVRTKSAEYLKSMCKKDGPGIGSKITTREACCKTCTDMGFPPESSGPSLDQLREVVNETKEMVQQLRNELVEIRASVTKKTPGFMVQLKSTIQPPQGSIIKLKRESSNADGHYSPRTGKYTCPVDGWYIFSYTISGTGLTKNKVRRLSAELIRDGVMVNTIEENNYLDASGFINLQGSNMAYVKCLFGQKVWLRTNQYAGHVRLNTVTFVGLLINGLQ